MKRPGIVKVETLSSRGHGSDRASARKSRCKRRGKRIERQEAKREIRGYLDR